MTSIMFTALALALSLSLLLASTPLLLGAWLLLLTFSISGIFVFSLSSWLGIFTLLIYVGGLLVMFAYFVALAPNQILEVKTMIMSTFFIFILSSLALLSYFSFFPFQFQAPKLAFPITALLSSSNMSIFVMLALILFFTLIAVVKISTLNSGPLRPWKFLYLV